MVKFVINEIFSKSRSQFLNPLCLWQCFPLLEMHILLIAMAMSIEHLTILTFQKCSSCQLLFSDIVKFLARLNWNQTYSTRSECICAIVTMVFRLCIIASNCEKCADSEVAKSYMPLATEFENLHASGHSIDCLRSSSRQRWCKKLRSHVW